MPHLQHRCETKTSIISYTYNIEGDACRLVTVAHINSRGISAPSGHTITAPLLNPTWTGNPRAYFHALLADLCSDRLLSSPAKGQNT